MNILDQLQRKMLRRIVGWRRIPGESWEDTMRRMKLRLEHAQDQHYIDPWSRRWARAQWKYACHLTVSSRYHWARLATIENIVGKFDPCALYVPNRLVGRPRLRWDDTLRHFFYYFFQLSVVSIG